ncbi:MULTISPECIES: thymidylate kinase [Pseudomonas]|uniref:thymidylate kinase n=1 Tax=Pseudomonas TaxID=286 RepID=UPI002B251DB4|nr:thymidylate kinase [Pseudomonas putida]
MTVPFFVSFDGPKATGKTTVLNAVAERLRACGTHQVIQLCEKELDPYRPETLEMIKSLTANPSTDLELLICERLADGRAWISSNVVLQQTDNAVVLIDRWYPSDAAFRRLVNFPDILRMNLDRSVVTPDLHVGVLAPPKISWERAAGRARGLSSVVIKNYSEHEACSAAFERAVEGYGWFTCQNVGTVEVSADLVVSAIAAGRSRS